MQKSRSLKCEPSSELLLITAKQLFLIQELYLSVQPHHNLVKVSHHAFAAVCCTSRCRANIAQKESKSQNLASVPGESHSCFFLFARRWYGGCGDLAISKLILFSYDMRVVQEVEELAEAEATKRESLLNL